MAKRVPFDDAKANLEELVREAGESRDPIVIERAEAPDVALIAAAELRALTETARLVRSNENADRLLKALADSGGASVEDIRKALGLEPE